MVSRSDILCVRFTIDMHKTSKIYLSPLKVEDSPTLFEWINRRDLVLFNSGYKPIHEGNHHLWFDSVTQKNDLFIFAIRKVENNELIGSCQLNNINWVNRNAELQIRIAADDNRNKGFGADALSLLLKFGFNDLNLNKIYLNVFATNLRAVRAYERAGFINEGNFKQQAYIDGSYVDVVFMGILKKDYDKRLHASGNTPA